MTWKEWATRYSSASGLTGEMLAEWVRRFQQAGYAVEELADAADWLLLHPPGPRPSLAATAQAQLDGLLGRVRDARARARDAEAQAGRLAAEPPPPSGPCELCGGGGLVLGLTYAKCYSRGRRGRACCSCRCAAGQRLHRLRADAGFPLRSLDQHEVEFPDWRERSGERESAVPSEAGLGGVVEQVIRMAKVRSKK